eukprot:842742-Rhodomonas_salina.2
MVRRLCCLAFEFEIQTVYGRVTWLGDLDVSRSRPEDLRAVDQRQENVFHRTCELPHKVRFLLDGRMADQDRARARGKGTRGDL